MFTLGSRWVNSSNRTLKYMNVVVYIRLVIILYSVVNYYDMIYAVTILDIYLCNYLLGACLLNLVTCASIASCLGGRCVCAIFLGMVSGSSK